MAAIQRTLTLEIGRQLAAQDRRKRQDTGEDLVARVDVPSECQTVQDDPSALDVPSHVLAALDEPSSEDWVVHRGSELWSRGRLSRLRRTKAPSNSVCLSAKMTEAQAAVLRPRAACQPCRSRRPLLQKSERRGPLPAKLAQTVKPPCFQLLATTVEQLLE
eukprot:2675234-Prymnesium_polylepis.1